MSSFPPPSAAPSPVPSEPGSGGGPGDQPLVSVVVPAYNVAPYVEQALVSALDQTYRRIEVIVVNDGSTDSTRSVIERVLRDRGDPRLRVIDQPNAGLSAARNSGVDAARGELVAFLDSDDAWRPDKLEKHVRLLARRPRVGLSFSYSEYMTEDGRPTGHGPVTTRLAPSLHDMVRRNQCGNGSSIVVRRECLRIAGPFREELRSCEDYELWCRMLWATSYEAACIPEPLTLYRQREASLSFDAARFTQNADLAMRLLRETMPSIPERLMRAGHAEHYRIAALKAATLGQDEVATRLLARALRLWPWLLVSDRRTLATAATLLMPRRLRQPLIDRYRTRLAARRRRMQTDRGLR